MEVDGDEMAVGGDGGAIVNNNGLVNGNVMASPSTVGSVTTSLHPLVIMNISEHWTRHKAQEGQAGQVIGALIGQHRGRHVEIMNSFELVFSEIDGYIVIDRDYYRLKEEQFKQVFQDMDFLGWYTNGDVPTAMDVHVQKQICEINESPIFLKLNPIIKNSDLPVSVYESVIDIVNGQTTMLFVQLSYVLATEEAERIGVDHVARVSATDSGENSFVAEHLQAQYSAIKMLHSRVKLILDYVKAVERGEVPICHETLRLAYSLCHRLPIMQANRFKPDFYEQCNDVNLITYLGMITKGCEEAHQFIQRFNLLHEKQGMRRIRDSKRARLDKDGGFRGILKSNPFTSAKLKIPSQSSSSVLSTTMPNNPDPDSPDEIETDMV